MKRGSFTQTVKDEICSLEYTDAQLLGLLSGFIMTNGRVDFDNDVISLSTESSKIAKLIYKSINHLFNISPIFTYSKKMKLDKCVVYNIKIVTCIEEILEELELYRDREEIVPHDLILNNGLRSFIAGVFLASGSVNSPVGDNYHLQMVVDTEQDGKFLIKLLNRFRNEKNMDSKMIARRKKYVVYLKKADQIANFLAVVNASTSMLQFENVRIEKDFINSDNRYQICYNANYQKTLEKATKQIEDIKIIEEKLGLKLLNEKEQIIAEIRLNNVDIPLSQIADILLDEYQIKMSKSSVNRVFISLHELAERLEGKK